ncbi:hypothetical protein OH768_52420 [Streptomyces sp. NBC_01622]|uniref:hypothetical protein n=1 Tax=Streptomyces sp. NBC_01622 TaxID=2975903 RepID=UPI003868944F|nr:hypothetical protein OH768_52420 [Streptomyces sp. NBC_01622]
MPRSITDTIADNAAAAMIVGGRVMRPMDVDVRWVATTLAKNGVIEESGVSVSQHLEAGQMLLSGSFTRPVSVEPNTVSHADFNSLGSIGVVFQ